jgi:ABC-2 type transport system ATP-binding protein
MNETHLEVRNISKHFFRKEALKNVSLSVNKGEIFGLLGPNGAGKTTLIRVINRIIEPDEGTVRFDGHLMIKDDLKRIGYLPEERGLYKDMTVESHAMFLGKLRGLEKKDIRSKMAFWFDTFDMNGWRKKRIEELSKGMAQKVQFMCAVLHEPDLLILDEPFSGFDPVNVELIKKQLKRMRGENKTIILSTHNMKNVEEICDRAALIHQSKKIAEGTISELQGAQRTGLFAVRFRGNMLTFVNALWTGFEVHDTTEHGDNRYTVRVRLRNESSFDDLLKVLIGQISIEAAWEVLPTMQDVFIKLVTPADHEE